MPITPFDASLSDDLAPQALTQRSRLLMRLLKADSNAVSDAELLELVLSSVPGISNINALSIRLLERFGTLNQAICADEIELRAIPEVDEAVLCELATMRLTAQRMAKSEIKDRPIIQSWAALMEYCKLAMGHNKVEEFRVLYLNHAHTLIADEVMQRGTVNHTPVYPREIVKRALEHSAAALVLLHNHPAGDPTPSKADIDITEKIVVAAAALGIGVHDHVLIAGNTNYSFRSSGLMPEDGLTTTALSDSSQTQLSLW